MMIVLYIIVGLVILFLILSLMGPRTYAVSRSAVIDKPRQELYNYLKSLKNQNEWSPWSRKDPDMEQEFVGTDGEVGSVSKWKGNKQVGEGEQEITKLIPNERIESELRFFKPWKAESDAYIHLENAEINRTKVTWGFSGENKSAMMRVMGLFMNMDKAIGKDFEEGLDNLQEIFSDRSSDQSNGD